MAPPITELIYNHRAHSAQNIVCSAYWIIRLLRYFINHLRSDAQINDEWILLSISTNYLIFRLIRDYRCKQIATNYEDLSCGGRVTFSRKKQLNQWDKMRLDLISHTADFHRHIIMVCVIIFVSGQHSMPWQTRHNTHRYNFTKHNIETNRYNIEEKIKTQTDMYVKTACMLATNAANLYSFIVD